MIIILYIIVVLLVCATPKIASWFADTLYSSEKRIFFITEFHRLEHNIFETMRSFHKMFNVRKSAKNVKIVLFALFENYSSGELWRRSETVTDSNVETVQKVIQHHFCVLDWPPYLSYFALYDFFLRERVCVCRVSEIRGILPKYLNNFITEKILFVLCQNNFCRTVDTG